MTVNSGDTYLTLMRNRNKYVSPDFQKLNGGGLLVLNLPGEERYKKELANFACQLADMMKRENERPDYSRASLV